MLILSAVTASSLALAFSMQACSSIPNPLDNGTNESKPVDPDKIATIEIEDPDIGGVQTLTLYASNSGDCQDAIRMIRARDYKQARSTLIEHVADKESDSNAWYALGALYEYDEDYKNALRCYQSAVINDKKASGDYQAAVDRVINFVDE